MNVIVIPLLELIGVVLQLYLWVVIAAVVLSWLVAFNMINTHNQAIRFIGNAVHQLTEPVLRRIRRVIPSAGGLDLSPLVLFLLIYLIQRILGQLIFRLSM